MEKYNLATDITILCLRVPAFPQGVQEAFNTLEKRLPSIAERGFYGISYFDEAGQLVYKAAAQQMAPEEATAYFYETFTIVKGAYLSVTIPDWKKHLTSIGEIFMQLIKKPEADKLYPCIEWYKTEEEMLCMVKIDTTKP